MVTRQKRWLAIATSAVVIAGGIGAATLLAWPFIKTSVFLLDIAGTNVPARPLLPVGRSTITTEDLSIPTRQGSIAGRAYLPTVLSTRSIIVFPGVHGGGVDEPRLDGFSRRLAATGVNVVSVPLPDLREFRITGRSTDVIEDATVWMLAEAKLAPRGRVGMVGISFAGGLALVAAGRSTLAPRLDAVVSVGGHGDLGRVLRYLCTGVLPDGTPRPPHDYGLAIVALAAAPLVAPADQIPALERAIRAYLHASLDESVEQRQAQALLAEVRRAAREMPEPSRSLLAGLDQHDVAALGRLLAPHIDALSGDSRLSPEQSPATSARVFLLQGLEDNVIPSSETRLLADYLGQHGNSNVASLLTPALSHLGLDPGIGWSDAWRFVRFWTEISEGLD